MWRVGGLLVVLCVLLAGCAKEQPRPTPTLIPVTPSVTPKPAVRPPPTRVPTSVPATRVPVFGPPLTAAPQVFWEPAELPVFTGEEHESPWDFATNDEPIWRLYEVGQKGGPRLIYETPRWPGELAWTPGEASIRMKVGSKAASSSPGDYGLQGIVEVTRDGTETVIAPLVQARAYDVGPASPDGRRPFVQFRPNEDGPIYVERASGEVVRLSGLGDNTSFVDWTPDGEALVLRVRQDVDDQAFRFEVESGLYIVPLRDGVATLMAKAVSAWGEWSPDGTKLPLLADGQVLIFDRGTGSAVHITSDSGGRFTWSLDGTLLASQADLLNPTTGERLGRLITPGNEVSTRISGDGRYFLASEDPRVGVAPDELCPRTSPSTLRNRTHVYDTQSGATEVVLDCDSGFFLVGEELTTDDGTHRFILERPGCWGCDGGSNNLHLLTLETGEVSTLTESGGWHDAVPSPDGRRVFLTGVAPRVVGSDGSVLEEVQIPPGTAVQKVLWAADGMTYYYLLGPASKTVL